MSDAISITFPDASLAQGNQLAMSLASDLSQTDPSVKVSVTKASSETQDFGSVLLLVISTGAASAVASGIAAWISKQGNPRIELKHPDGTSVTIKRADQHTAEIVRAALTNQR